MGLWCGLLLRACSGVRHSQKRSLAHVLACPPQVMSRAAAGQILVWGVPGERGGPDRGE